MAKPNAPTNKPAAPSGPQAAHAAALANPIAASDEMFSPRNTSSSVTSGFLKGFLRGALVMGLIGGAVAFGLGYFELIGEAVYEGTKIGNIGAVPEVFAGLSQATLSLVGTITASAAFVGGLVFGTREAAGRQGAAAGYQHGRQVGRLETMAVTEAVVQEIAVGMEQQMAHKQQPQKAAEKKVMTFEHLGDQHPANKPKTPPVAQGTHSRNIMEAKAIEAALGANGRTA
jgi:nitrogen fixation protein FixH